MKIDRHIYQHGEQKGCLLRVRFGAWRVGYADLHPWPEYGDVPLDQQFQLWSEGTPSNIFRKSLLLAEADAEGRRQSRNLLLGLQLPTSHKLLNIDDVAAIEEAFELGYRHFKIKIGRDLERERKFLETLHGRIRLDANGKLTFSEFSKWWNSLSESLRARVDVVEDAYRDRGKPDRPQIFYSDWLWNSDWQGRVLKPARDDIWEQSSHRSVLFTHSLDHPIAQAAAVWEAACFYQQYPHLRQPGGFSPADGFDFDWNRGPRLKPTPGTGFGFDGLLNSLRWERLI